MYFSVFKQFAATERLRVQFRGEFFNILNLPQFDLPGQTIGSPAAGVITPLWERRGIFS